jgi:hypothetical protein
MAFLFSENRYFEFKKLCDSHQPLLENLGKSSEVHPLWVPWASLAPPVFFR